MSASKPPTTPQATSSLTVEESRWLHDKYERLASEESGLAGTRTSYFAAIGTVLITGLIWLVANLISRPPILAIMVSVLALIGITISLIWAVLLHRTLDAQNLWREAARDLETMSPPVPATMMGPVTLRSGETMQVDLSRPFLAHQARFARGSQVSWQDRTDPTALTELLPQMFIVMWTMAIVVIWVWFLFLQ